MWSSVQQYSSKAGVQVKHFQSAVECVNVVEIVGYPIDCYILCNQKEWCKFTLLYNSLVFHIGGLIGPMLLTYKLKRFVNDNF